MVWTKWWRFAAELDCSWLTFGNITKLQTDGIVDGLEALLFIIWAVCDQMYMHRHMSIHKISLVLPQF